MKIGLISDVHGNQPALTKVLADMPDVDAIYHLGDLVGYNPFPQEVLNTFAREGIQSIQGNHDRKISGNIQSMGTAPEPDGSENNGGIRPGELARAAGEWTLEHLTDSELKYLSNLPKEQFLLDGSVKLVHGRPGDQDGRLYPDEYSEQLFEDEQILAHGHTHIQHVERFGDRILVNPGSVGQPRDGDPRAAYAVLDVDSNTVQLYRVSYPIEDVTDVIQQTEIPNLLCVWLRRGEIVLE